MATPYTRKKIQPADVNDYMISDDDEYYVTRPQHTSARRYRQPAERDTQETYVPDEIIMQQRRVRNIASAVDTSERARPADEIAPRRHKRRVPWLLFFFCICLALGLVASFNSFSSWLATKHDDDTYGRPRTWQHDAVVGHQDSAQHKSHFLFMNVDSRIVVIEFPGGDSAHPLIYNGPTLFGENGDLIPVTGEFQDINGDKKIDMLVKVQGETIPFINDGKQFRPVQSGEEVHF
jgi:hypothetical protein